MSLQILEQEKRHQIDIALAAARKRLSAQTGWVHLCYESVDTRHDTIPLFENFCFALALFRSRLSEDILKGKELIEKLLAFEVDGHFPVYLHEYPHVRDRGLGIDILTVLIHLTREFSSVLGDNLESRLTSLSARIIAHGEAEEHCSYGRRAKLQAAQGKFRLVPGRKIHSSSQLVEELIALQLQGAYTESDLLDISQFWHSKLKIYRGPYARELQEGGGPLPTLFDFFMGQLFGHYPARVSIDHPIQLRASLVYPFCSTSIIDGDSDSYLWLMDQESKAVHLFWEGGGQTHSLVFQGATGWQSLGESLFAIECSLSEQAPSISEEKSEVSCFFNYHPNHEICINGGKASAFYLDQSVTILSQPFMLELQFSVQGEGMFFGHILRGNRPRQIATRGEKRFEAYDWQIALRTLSRQSPCTLRILCKLSSY